MQKELNTHKEKHEAHNEKVKGLITKVKRIKQDLLPKLQVREAQDLIMLVDSALRPASGDDEQKPASSNPSCDVIGLLDAGEVVTLEDLRKMEAGRQPLLYQWTATGPQDP
jgi:hypothetical protein